MSISKPRSKRQFRSANVKKAFRVTQGPRGDRSKANFNWLTRTHGTAAQRGQKFQVMGEKGHLPPLSIKTLKFKKPNSSELAALTSLEKQAMNAQKKTILNGQKGWIIGLRFSDGSSRHIPIIAESWEEAVRKIQPRIAKENIRNIEEMTIIDPSLKEIAHAIGSGARKAASAIGRGVSKISGFAKKEAKEVARAAGRAVAIPGRLEQEYTAAKEERLGVPVSRAAGAASHEEAALAEARRLARIGTEPVEHGYAPGEIEGIMTRPGGGVRPIGISLAPPEREKPEYAPEFAERLRTIQARDAEARAAARTKPPMTPSQLRRKAKASSMPFQSRVFGRESAYGSEAYSDFKRRKEIESDGSVAKLKRQIRHLRRRLRAMREM